MFKAHLLSLKSAINDKSVIEIEANISQDYSGHFKDHSQLLDHIKYQIIPICNSYRSYKFLIHFNSDYNAVTNVISSILNLLEARRCSSAAIQIYFGKGFDGQKSQLPVEVISNWLESAHGVEMNIRNKKENFLKISVDSIQNAQQMVNHLKMVSFIYFKIFAIRFFAIF